MYIYIYICFLCIDLHAADGPLTRAARASRQNTKQQITEASNHHKLWVRRSSDADSHNYQALEHHRKDASEEPCFPEGRQSAAFAFMFIKL